ncbi:uncharacterized protein LOC127286944 [Leptopilina boulardi]|uniref:uncharacterized protein LOC127286944 n=1 Tax=Leptopilina boulardi TaxID=63433 RepID=UPI0021F686C8|nr:uncharacterized protein LOC127286944 [Leptopilina boulardi]
MMYSLILAAVMFISVVNCIPQPPPLTEEMKKNMDECRTELGLTIEEERELHKKRDFDNEKMRCIPACLMKKDGILQDNKEINMDKWYEKIQQFKDLTDDMKKSLQDCYEQVKSKEEDECKFAHLLMHCTHRVIGHPPGPHREN